MKRSTTFLIVVWILCSTLAPVFADDTASKVLATYGDKKLTFEEFAKQQPALASWVGVNLSQEQIESTLSEMILISLAAQEAQKTGLADDPEIQSQITKILSTAYWKAHAPRERMEVPDSEVEQFYNANLEKFKIQGRTNVSHILVNTETEAKTIHAALQKGANWQEQCKAHSIDPLTSKRGGTLGLVASQQLLSELRPAADTLKIGTFSDPIKTSFGYHIVKVDARPPAEYQPFNEIKKDVLARLVRDRQQVYKEEVRSDLWKKYGVSIDSTSIAELIKAKTSENMNVEKASLGRQLRKPGQPTELQAISETIDYGKVPSKKITDTFLLINSSNKEIKINRVGSTCNCIQTSVDTKELAPGKTAKVTFTYDPTMFHEKGVVQKVVFVESNDIIEPRKFIQITAELPKA